MVVGFTTAEGGGIIRGGSTVKQVSDLVRGALLYCISDRITQYYDLTFFHVFI